MSHADSNCTQWRGTVHGNDPSVAVTATVCLVGDHDVRGVLVWNSQVSGSSVRTLEGTHAGATLTLHDVTLRGKPNDGWRFCMVDRYALTRHGDQLAGTYHSSACYDDASIALTRVR